MTALLALLTVLAGLLVKLVLATAVLTVGAATVWVLWDCLVGPSAQLARAGRRRVVGVHGR